MSMRKSTKIGVSLMPYSESEKIGLIEWFDVHRHSRRLYVLIDEKDVRQHDIQVGDHLRMKIEVIQRGPRDKEVSA
jgi:hypothetical protein